MSAAQQRRVVRRLAGIVVGVPRPGRTAAFLEEALGFTVVDSDAGPLALCEGDYGQEGPQRALTLVGRAEVEVVEMTLEAAAGADLGALERAVGEHGATAVVADGDVLRFRDPSGVPVAVAPAGARPDVTLAANGLRPRRLGHANLKVVDLLGGTRFWVRALGMSLSEQIGDDLAFLRFGAEHHNLGMRVAPQTTLHHLGFEVPGWDAYRPLLDHLAALGHQAELGPGRHQVGQNLFTYLRDPDSGLRLELFADMARVEEQPDPEQAPIRWRSEDRLSRTLNRWSSAPPPQSFLA